MMIKDMTPEEKEKYFNKIDEECGCMYKYEDDLLCGRIHIADVPYEYRSDSAYIMACRRTRALPEGAMIVERKIIETLLLSDIIKATQQGQNIEGNRLRVIFMSYFSGAYTGLNLGYECID